MEEMYDQQIEEDDYARFSTNNIMTFTEFETLNVDEQSEIDHVLEVV